MKTPLIATTLLLLSACAAPDQSSAKGVLPQAAESAPAVETPGQAPGQAGVAQLSDLPAPVRDNQAVEASMHAVASAALAETAGNTAAQSSSSAPANFSQSAAQGSTLVAASESGRVQSEAASPLVPRGMSAPELDLWNDPGFLARFTGSYLPDTAIEPIPSDEESLTLVEVAELLGDNRPERAIVVLEKRRQKESSALLDCYLANLYFSQDRQPEAAALYRSAVEKFPKFRRAWSNLALSASRQEDYKTALQAAVRTLELGGFNGDLYGILGVCHMQMENFVAAESAYRMANLLEPGNLDWEAGMANAFFQQQRFQEAIALLGTLIAKNPNQANLWAQQAKAYLRLGQPLKAAENLKVVDSMGAADVETLRLLANIYINDGLTELGADYYLRALELQPEGLAGDVLTAARSVLYRYNASEDAERLLSALPTEMLAVDLQKERLNLLARISIEKDPSNVESAVLLEELVALDPLDGDALIRLARSYGSRGDTEKALFLYERAAGLSAFEERAKLAQGQYLAQIDRGSEALPLLRRALELRRERNASGTGKQDPVEQIEKFLEYVERKVQGRGGA